MPSDGGYFINENESFKKIGSEHGRLLHHLDALAFCIKQKSAEHNAIAAILDDLLEETREHFAHEEEIMVELGYPEYDNHQKDHNRILALIKNLIEQHQMHLINVEMDEWHLMEQAMVTHLTRFDRDLIALLSG